MKTFKQLMHCDGCTGRLTFQRNIAGLAAGKAAVDMLTHALVPGTEAGLVALAWLNPFVLVKPGMEGAMPFTICLSSFAFFAGLVWNSVHRLRDSGHPHWLGPLAAVPYLNLPFTAVLAFLPTRKHTVWDLV